MLNKFLTVAKFAFASLLITQITRFKTHFTQVDSELTELRPVDPLASAESNLQKRANGYAQRLLMRTNVRSSPLSNLNSSQTNSPGSQSSSSTTDYVDQSYENWKPRSTELQENEEHKSKFKLILSS